MGASSEDMGVARPYRRANQSIPDASIAFDAIIEVIAERVASRILARLGSPTTHYGSGRKASPPPGKSRAWAVRNLKTIPGARKIGRDWIVSVEDFDAWAADRDSARCGKIGRDARQVRGSSFENDNSEIAALVESSLREAGLRRVRGSTR